MPDNKLADKVLELARLAEEVRTCVVERKFDALAPLSAQQELCLETVLLAVRQGESLSGEDRQILQTVLTQREEVQSLLADWSRDVQQELVSINQNNRLIKTYSL
ncbi:hypothetical protein [Paludibacterium denitrificans]|uniref:Flagellar protein FliT n=1 Tax=Paludibacterium denitrificans TaxID=2675226 RepID=A0A844GE76_9NEIS|nr:hypothetical protein [Paludibacterium denitrificans]MTD32865.1 hypothetical protein [Paludibacterium denitrificans]